MAPNLEGGGRSMIDSKRRRRKKRKIEPVADRDVEVGGDNNQIRWTSVIEHRTYSSKLVDALRNIRRRTTSMISSPANSYSRTRSVRETADRVLAVAAKGRTRWSRAILTSRLRISLMNQKKAKVKSKTPSAAEDGSKEKSAGRVRRKKRLPALQRRVRYLGRLIPGCRKLPLPNLLEETTDYIAALEMQVRAMAALADLLAGSGPAAGERGSAESSKI
ncbi:hypothetical protein Dimus_012128 [Dionaea muscipula]